MAPWQHSTGIVLSQLRAGSGGISPAMSRWNCFRRTAGAGRSRGRHCQTLQCQLGPAPVNLRKKILGGEDLSDPNRAAATIAWFTRSTVGVGGKGTPAARGAHGEFVVPGLPLKRGDRLLVLQQAHECEVLQVPQPQRAALRVVQGREEAAGRRHAHAAHPHRGVGLVAGGLRGRHLHRRRSVSPCSPEAYPPGTQLWVGASYLRIPALLCCRAARAARNRAAATQPISPISKS